MIQRIFFHNYLLMLPIVSWLAAQIIKTILYFILNRTFSIERMVGAGGMPSSHSALVCSLLVGTARKMGLDSPIFAIAFVLAMVVMYDAMGVRRETGRQAQVLNDLLAKLKAKGTVSQNDKLKEMVGHTPLQVFAGSVLGVTIALLSPVF